MVFLNPNHRRLAPDQKYDEDLDSKENPINYIGMLRKNDTFKVSTINGHRFYLVPHRLDIDPPYHPLTDKQFFIEPYLQLNIHKYVTSHYILHENTCS